MSYRSILIALGATALCTGLWLSRSPLTTGSEATATIHAQRATENLPAPTAAGRSGNAQLEAAPRLEAAVPSAETLSAVPATEDRQTIDDFADWINRYSAASDEGRALLAETGLALAQSRQAALRELIETDPEAALAAALTWEQRRLLPRAFNPWLERPVNTRADYAVTISDDLENLRREVRREATIAGETFRAFTYGRLASLGTTSLLPVNGIAVGDVLALAESPVRQLSAAEAQFARTTLSDADPVCSVSGESSTAYRDEQLVEIAGEFEFLCRSEHVNLLNQEWTTDAAGKWQRKSPDGTSDGPVALDSWSQGPKTVLFIRVNFPDDLADPISEADAYNLMNDVNTWIVANSYGSSAMISTVTPLLTLPGTKAYYSQVGDGQLLTDARAVAKQAGFDTTDFQLDAVRFTSVPGYSYGGKAYVRGKGCWLQSSSVGVAVHEFGHNYGLWHANFWTSSQASGIGPGSHNEYGDFFDTMGSAGAGDKHFNANHRNKIDWLGDNYIQPVTGSGTFRLHAFDIDQLTLGRFYGLKITKDFDREYWVELRHRFASNKHIQNGVLLRWDPWADSAGGAHLLDTTPGSPAGNSSKDDAAVVLGRTFADEGAGIFITPVAMQGTGPEKSVDLVVQTGAFPGNQLPTVAVQAGATQTGTNQPIVFTASATDGDGDVLAYEWEFGDLNFGANSPVVTNVWSAAGEYVVRCRVSDMKGGLASAHVLIRVGNPTTYRISGRIVDAAGNPVEGVRVHNGATTSSTYRGGFTDSDGNYIITRLAVATHTISATLYGYNFTAQGGWTNPVGVGPDQTGIDFVASALPVVGWEVVDDDLGEAGGNVATLRLARTGSSASALTVKYKRAGSAAYTSDYSLSPTPGGTSPYSLTIPAGASFINVTVTPVQDVSSEGPETAFLALAEDAAYKIGWQAEARLEITDDENPGKPAIYLSSGADDRATETGADTAAFTVSRSGNKTGDVTVNFTLGGTATPNLDYTPPAGSVVIPDGETAVTVTFAALDDNRVEGDETVVVNVTPDAAYTISGGSTSLSIQDDDPPLVKISVTDNLAVEGGSATARITVQRVGSLTAPLTVNYAVSGTALSGADFTALPGSLVIPAGAASAGITITATNDTVTEGDESVALTLLGSANYNVGLPGAGVVTIQDNEIPTITITATDATATEGGADNGTFSIARGTATTGNLTVFLAASGQALPGEDYADLPASVSIPAGSTNVTLSIAPVDDTLNEADEKVTLTLAASSNYNLGTTGPISVTIKDNDTGGSIAIGFESGTSSLDESQTSVRLPVVLSAAAATTVTVNYSVTGGTAQSGADFTLAAGTLSFAANQRLATVNFSLANDSVAEGNETIVITLATPAGAVLDAVDSHTLTIVDDDASVVTLTATDASAAEGGGTGNFRVSRTGSTSAPVTVTVQITGTASSPSDFATLPDTILIPAGSSQVDLLITPVNDPTDELDESVNLRLTTVLGGRIGSPSSATVTIVDDDVAAALPEVSLAALDDLTAEGTSDTARVEFRRNGAPAGDLLVRYITGGSATAGTDVPPLPGTVTILDGQATASVVIQAASDGTIESMETFSLHLTPDAGYAIGLTNSVTLRLADSPFMAWQLVRFTPQQLQTPGISEPSADPDGDGHNNFTEYAFDRNPNTADTSPLFTQTLVTIGQTGDRLLEIAHHRRQQRTDVNYTLGVAEVVTGSWLEGPTHLEEVSVIPDANGVTETVRTQVLAPLSHFNQRFVRIRVSRP